MIKNLLLGGLLAASATMASAQSQVITVVMTTSWAVTPVNQFVLNPYLFQDTSTTPVGEIRGFSEASIGTWSNQTRSQAACAGSLFANNPLSGSSTAGASGTNIYTRTSGTGGVSGTLCAAPLSPTSTKSGTGYSGIVRASAQVSNSLFGTLKANSMARAVVPSGVPVFPTSQSITVCATVNASGQSVFSLSMLTTSSSSGSVSAAGDNFRIYAGAIAYGAISLN